MKKETLLNIKKLQGTIKRKIKKLDKTLAKCDRKDYPLYSDWTYAAGYAQALDDILELIEND